MGILDQVLDVEPLGRVLELRVPCDFGQVEHQSHQFSKEGKEDQRKGGEGPGEVVLPVEAFRRVNVSGDVHSREDDVEDEELDQEESVLNLRRVDDEQPGRGVVAVQVLLKRPMNKMTVRVEYYLAHYCSRKG